MSSDQHCQPVPSAIEEEPRPFGHEVDPDVAISVRDLGKCYHIYSRPQDRLKQAVLRWRGVQYFREFWAVRHVCFDIRRGEAVGIVGRNGSGKSTLLQVIAGTVTPSEGEVRVNGRVAALLELGSGFNPEFTGRENVFLNGSILGISQAEMQNRFDQIASFADIGDFMDQPVKTYSSGMYLRLAFSVAISVSPDILIIDEALAVGDILFQHRCMNRIRQMCEAGTTLLFVSHDPESVRALCQRALWLENGTPKLLDTARTVSERYLQSFLVEHNSVVLETQACAALDPDEPDWASSASDSFDGAGVLEVASCRILSETGHPTKTLKQGERFTFEAVVRASREVRHISVGFNIKDRLGIELTGESVFNAYGRGFSLRAGQSRMVRFAGVNNLRDGEYCVSVRLNRVSKWDRSDNVLVYNDEVAANFRVLPDPDRPIWFRFRHPFEVTVT